ncbi:S-adenosylmethionine decarboxylase [Patescibacteria group bacterium]|nr:S-adenosylmethionine decarboxylase [Patescibacteria group bacterium]
MEQVTGLRQVYRSDALDALARDDSVIREEYQRNQAWGLLASVDLHHCNPATIRDAEKIKQFTYELCKKIDMQRYGECQVVRFGNGELEGYSMFQFIETSCISAHFDEMVANTTYLDIFSCKYFNPYEASEFAKEFFEAKDYNLTYTLRK